MLGDGGCLLSVAIFPCHGNMSPCACQHLACVGHSPFCMMLLRRVHGATPVCTSPHQSNPASRPAALSHWEGDRMGAGPCVSCCPVAPYAKVSPSHHRGPKAIRYHHGQRFADQLWTSHCLTGASFQPAKKWLSEKWFVTKEND